MVFGKPVDPAERARQIRGALISAAQADMMLG